MLDTIHTKRPLSYGHVERMPDNRGFKKLLGWIPPKRRTRGSQGSHEKKTHSLKWDKLSGVQNARDGNSNGCMVGPWKHYARLAHTLSIKSLR